MAEDAARLTSLTLKSFKSYLDAVLPLGPFTLLVGRNASGKSNAIDGLWVLSRLAGGADIRDALDGGREGPEIRGGILGCVRPGESEFSLGCSAISSHGVVLNYEVTIQAEPVVQVTHERLWTVRTGGNKKGQDRDLLLTDPADTSRSDIVVRWDNQKRGMNPPVDFRASQLALTQVVTRVPATSSAGREIHTYAQELLSALQDVFVLDPVPNQMRQYVRKNDSRLRRNADNISAALARLLVDNETHRQVLELIQGVSESKVLDISIAESRLEDVMLVLEERFGDDVWSVPARQMSDGTLRFLALVAALLQSPEADDDRRDEPDPPAQTALVIEEVENGLHPSQAARIVQLLRDQAEERDVRVLATTHSPALLDALPGMLHGSVVACWRSDDGVSRLAPLPELGSYFDIVASGSLGEAAAHDSFRPPTASKQDPRVALDRLFAAS